MTCSEAREALGALVLGALDPEERAEVLTHLATCPECAAAHRELAALPPLLGLVSAEQLEQAADPFAGDRIWRGLLERARAHERGQRRRTFLAAAASAVAAGIIAIGATLAVSAESPDGNQNQAGEVETEAVSARDESTGVHATVGFRSVGWGTSLSLSLGGVEPLQECALVVVGSDGRTEIAASWQVPAAGYGPTGSIKVDAATGLEVTEIDHYEIVSLDNDEVLLEIPTAAA